MEEVRLKPELGETCGCTCTLGKKEAAWPAALAASHSATSQPRSTAGTVGVLHSLLREKQFY